MQNKNRELLEANIVNIIHDKLIHHEITGDRAKEIAQTILKMIPEEITDEQLMLVVPQLDDQFSELASVVHKLLNEHDEKLKAEILPKIRAMINQAVNK